MRVSIPASFADFPLSSFLILFFPIISTIFLLSSRFLAPPPPTSTPTTCSLGSLATPGRRWRLPRSLVFFCAFLISISLCVAMYLSGNEKVSLACWVTINLVEVLAQFVADVIVP